MEGHGAWTSPCCGTWSTSDGSRQEGRGAALTYQANIVAPSLSQLGARLTSVREQIENAVGGVPRPNRRKFPPTQAPSAGACSASVARLTLHSKIQRLDDGVEIGVVSPVLRELWRSGRNGVSAMPKSCRLQPNVDSAPPPPGRHPRSANHRRAPKQVWHQRTPARSTTIARRLDAHGPVALSY